MDEALRDLRARLAAALLRRDLAAARALAEQIKQLVAAPE